MHLQIRGNELGDLSAASGAIFWASKLLKIVIRRRQEICDVTVSLLLLKDNGENKQTAFPNTMTTNSCLKLQCHVCEKYWSTLKEGNSRVVDYLSV